MKCVTLPVFIKKAEDRLLDNKSKEEELDEYGDPFLDKETSEIEDISFYVIDYVHSSFNPNHNENICCVQSNGANFWVALSKDRVNKLLSII